jgi:cysteine desulfurase
MPARRGIYLDSNAGAPLRPPVVEALRALLLGDGAPPLSNPSSIHSHGQRAKRLVAEARERVAASLGPRTDPEQVIFTSSGSEANQLAIRSVLEPLLERGERPHWIISPLEHDSTLQLVEWLEARGGSVSRLAVDERGAWDPASLEQAWRPGTALVSAVWVNNETGVIGDVAALVREARERGAAVHVDAAQAWGKLPLDVEALGAQLVSLSAHKIGGLAGTGALHVGRGIRVSGLLRGKQEKGRRGGTENLLGIVAMGEAAAHLDPEAWGAGVAALRDRLESAICERIPGTVVNGGKAPRVANTLNVSFDGVEGDGLVMALDLAGYSVSSGSACSSGALEPSHVLLAMGRSRAQAMAAVRVSLADDGLPWEALEGFVSALEAAVARVRGA